MSATSWSDSLASYLPAKAAEDAQDERVYGHISADMPIAPSRAMVSAIPDADHDEAERLADIRSEAEDVLMAIPSPDASAFLRKFLVAYGGGRDTDRWDEMLEAEAQSLLAQAEAMPASAITAWDRYSEAIAELGTAERDPATSSARRCELALTSHRAWAVWCEAMDQARGARPPLMVPTGGKAA